MVPPREKCHKQSQDNDKLENKLKKKKLVHKGLISLMYKEKDQRYDR